jgi:capsular polysaccharide biosynthesis protein
MHLHQRTRRVPPVTAQEEDRPSALYCSFPGNRYFGNWLIDDCVTYPLAREHGLLATSSSAIVPSPQMLQYEALLGMQPHRCDQTWFKRLVVFQDVGQNSHKRRRFKGLGDKLLRGRGRAQHPGVFILRGQAGERRLLANELQLAERLRQTRGFRIVDPMHHSAAEIVEICAGARAVVGVEGSQLVHGLLLLQPGGSLLTLQPPNRYCSLFKNLTDRDAQKFGIVVGTSVGDGFTIDADEVERTLDLMEPAHPQATTTPFSTLSSREDCTADTTPRVETADSTSILSASISS